MRNAGSPLAGFIRFLHLLSTHPWQDRPLVVDPTTQLTPLQHRAIQTQYDHAKANKAAKGFCICSPTDLEGHFWAQQDMTTALRQRVVKLASKSLQLLQVSPYFSARMQKTSLMLQCNASAKHLHQAAGYPCAFKQALQSGNWH